MCKYNIIEVAVFNCFGVIISGPTDFPYIKLFFTARYSSFVKTPVSMSNVPTNVVSGSNESVSSIFSPRIFLK